MGAVVNISPNAVHTGHQLDLIRRTVASDCNDTEFDLFVTVARHAGLDPFRKQISALVFNKGDAEKRKMAIITTIDGLRVIAARSGDYRPDEDEPEYTYDDALKGPANPLGLVKAVVRIFVKDRPVRGVAYWDEFAPIKEDVEGGYDWVDTGEVWPDTGKAKKRKVPRQSGAAVIKQLDTSGNWGRMPRVMLAKCAEAQALRKAFPEDLSGLYERAELDQAQTVELLPSEAVAHHQTEGRLVRIGVSGGIMFQLFPNAPLESIPLGKVADRVLEAITGFTDARQMRWFESANTNPLREFWARAPGDALELKRAVEKRRGELEAASQPEPA